ncbi:hypothetical protein FNV43_RR25242 [Rhamnella rubrinervis]|uniref:Uncharacterized protein n=1 Tax=Rhamnella rubrinervis TaxID=2594499 RepID=A0A8K0GPX0_9ROSA|nr:hypothetical protein FNV43_RR25242 [Rhamnella rubrinervis]
MNSHIDIQFISKGFIKPSVPTPDHLRHYQLSYLDQIAPSSFMPMVLFYKSNLTRQELCNRFKKSLSEVLTFYYPLAGRVKSKLWVDCNDEGAFYLEADVKRKLPDVFDNLSSNEVLEKFLPPLEFGNSNGVPLAVQLTFFECGSMAMSVKVSHEISDGLSYFMFVNAWTAVARRGAGLIKPPVLGAANFFPPKEPSSLPSNPRIVKTIVTDRFYFDAAKIAELVNKYTDNTATGVGRPSRFEALSSFIWNRFMVSTQPAKLGDDIIYTVRTGVNIRPKMQPPLTENYFGNISVVAVSPVPSLEANHGNYNIASSLRNAVKQINPEFVKQLRNGKTVDTLQRMDNGKEIIPFVFTKLSRYPLHELDFGWGSPVYGGSAAFVIKNNVSFVETETRDGIEAFVSLSEDEMAKFVADKEMIPIRSTAKRGRKSESGSILARF